LTLPPPQRQAQVQQRRRQQLPVLQQQRNKQPPNAPVPIEERMDRLELHVRQPRPHQRRQRILRMEPLLQPPHPPPPLLPRPPPPPPPRRRRTPPPPPGPPPPNPVRPPPDLSRHLLRPAHTLHQPLVRSAQEPRAEGQAARPRQLPPRPPKRIDVVAHFLDVL